MVELLAGQRQEKETKRAIQACNDYLRMGPGRSLQKLHRFYTESAPYKPPVKALRTLKGWSAQFGWQERANDYDTEIERQKNELAEARRREAMEAGLALDYERVLKLQTLADFLFGQIAEEDPAGKRPNVWLRDVKGIGKGADFERVEIERFNAALIGEFRATLDDIAKEVGGRKQQTELDVKLARRIEFFEVVAPDETGQDDGA
jgi:hypothetical protein